MKLEVNGTLYERFVSAPVDMRLDAFTRSFSFEVTGNELHPIPFAVGDPCRVFVGDEVVATGFLELITVDGDSEAHVVAFGGRGRCGDLVDSTIGSMDDIRPPVSLKAVCEKIIAHLDPDTPPAGRIQVVDSAAPDLFTKAEDLVAPDPGTPVQEVLEQLSRKRATWLTENGSGELELVNPSGVEVEAWVHHVKNTNDNNVMQYSYSYDMTGRFNRYRAMSALNPDVFLFAGEDQASKLVNQQGEAIDAAIRQGRQLVLVSESAASSHEDQKRATWERNVRYGRGRYFTAVVHGYTNQTGDIWRLNTAPWVISEMAGINTRMLLSGISFTMSPAAGRQSSLTFVERDSLTIDLQQPTEAREKEESGALFFEE